jgi:serine/threonine protein kinase
VSEQRPVPSDLRPDETAAVRRTGAAPLRPGDPRRVGPYTTLGLLGSGGMGRVYLARPTDDGPGPAAVKVVRPEYAEDPRFRRRFEREASVHARVRSPHIPRLCGTGFEDELLWMATEYLPGLDLAAAVRECGALETAAIWRLLAELGQALAGLAALEIVHRDLKPSNVLLSVQGAHVIDFGISKAADASAITATGNRVGTPAYMSPEHLREGRSEPASDVFSLGGTLVYAATGRAPFGDGTGVDVMHRVAFEEPDAALLGEICATDPALGSLLSACLDKEPERRPTPQDLIDAAGAHAGASAWPDPLGSTLRARQQAYEALYRLSAERTGSGPKPAPAEESSRTGSAAAEASTAPSSGSPRTRSRTRPALAVAAGVTLCVVAAGVFLLTRQDTPASASPPGADTATAVDAGPDGADRSPLPGTSSGPPDPGTDGKAEGPASDGTASSPEASGTAGHDRRGTSSTPTAEPGSSVDPTASPSDTRPEQPAPPPSDSGSGSDCTYYSGNGRTSRGDSGKRVREVQCLLTHRGYSVGGSGVFGATTEAAVHSFQSDNGLDADGIVGRETWAALRAALRS